MDRSELEALKKEIEEVDFKYIKHSTNVYNVIMSSEEVRELINTYIE